MSDFFFTNDSMIHIYIHELLRYTEDGCCWLQFLVGGVCGYNTRRIESLKKNFFSFNFMHQEYPGP